MRKILSALLLCVSISGLTGCGENEIKTATEIKDIISTYEANIENVDFSKFTLTREYSNHLEYNHNSIDEVNQYCNYVISYDESGYLYYKNQESTNIYTEVWLYIDGTNLIFASNNHTNSSDTKKYDILEFNSFEGAQERFLEEAPKRLDKFEDWYFYQYTEICYIPEKYCADYYTTASNLCERVINEMDPYITVITNDGSLLDIKFSDDQSYVFENGILKSYSDSYSGTRKFDKNGVGTVTETYSSSEKIGLLMSSDLSKPDLSSFEKFYH